jgi:hypothetical protein
MEETLFDIKKNKKVSVTSFIKTYLKSDGLKMISTLNNKIIVQADETFNIFSLKSPEEGKRFINSLSQYFYSIKRKDCMFVTDESSAQKKYLIKILSDWGIDKKILYRQYTTHPPKE